MPPTSDPPAPRRRVQSPMRKVVLLLAALACFAVAWTARSDALAEEDEEAVLAANAVRTQAVMASERPSCTSLGWRGGGSSCTGMVRFTTPDGAMHHATVDMRGSVRLGDPIAITYDATRPARAVSGTRVDHRLSGWANAAAILFLTGGLAFLTGLRRLPVAPSGTWVRPRMNGALPFIVGAMVGAAGGIFGFWWGLLIPATALVLHEAIRRHDRLTIDGATVTRARLLSPTRTLALAPDAQLVVGHTYNHGWSLRADGRRLPLVPWAWDDPEAVVQALIAAVRRAGGTVVRSEPPKVWGRRSSRSDPPTTQG